MSYTTEERVFCVKKFYQTGSVIRVQQEFRVTFECRECPSRSAINRLVRKFEDTGSVTDNKKGVVGRKKSARTAENIARVGEALGRSPNKSVKRISQELDLRQTSTLTIMREDVQKISMQKKSDPHPIDPERRWQR